MTETPTTHIDGSCDPAFSHVRDVFSENFRSRGEIGAAVCVYKDGRKVVDLWGGIANPDTGTPWQENTISCMMSVGKSMTALALLMLVDRGLVDLEAPVARYWPEFAQNGKETITVRTLVSGLAALIYADGAPDGSAYDWDIVCTALAAQKPEWEPGTQGAYHSVTCGYLLGEIVRRVDGRMIDVFFREEIAGPLGIDYGFGVAEADLPRVADIIPNPASVTLTQTQDPTTKLGRAWRIRPKSASPYNTHEYRTAVFPSSNGHGNARAIARAYALLGNGGTLDGVRLLSPALIEDIRTESWRGICGMTDRPFRYGLGFFLNYPPMLPFGSNARAFGHPGAGGAIGIADPEAGLAMSYNPNLMCAGAGVGDRCEALVEAVLGKQAVIAS
ncbi:serine hydrolase domain-containing protein [Govanella unica]|uniref:Beta-lactamase family protein n=1 Tax=Govanella unica TaxID=2975056 RepID=A0A9X3Z7U5_9PROT|nr:serine hydrolase domain-containing protein [Govania unica]MDA5194403.1 beta-lactamase family protein [Govania unica]